MAVVGVAKRLQDVRGQQYDGKIWTAERAWLVQTDSWDDDADTVSTASGLPAFGALHPNPVSSSMWAQSITYAPFESETPMLWKVSARYTSERELDPIDPNNDEILISEIGEIYQKRIQNDRNGDAVLNSAGDPFLDPPATRDDAHMIFRIRANFETPPSWFISHRNKVNSAPIAIDGLAVGTNLAKVQRIEASERKERNGTAYREVTLEIHVHEDGWKLDTLDAGLREYAFTGVGLTGFNHRHIINPGDLEEITEPVPLDGAGLKIEKPTPLNAVFLEFDTYPEADFSVLPGVT